MNTGQQRREAARSLKAAYGVRHYPSAKRCGECGCKAFKRTAERVCFECVVKQKVKV